MMNNENRTDMFSEPIEDFILELENKKIRIWVEGDTLRYKAPKGVVTAEVLQYIKERKDAIVEYLQVKADNSIFFEPINQIGDKEYFPLSAPQSRMLILNRIDKDSTAYNITQVIKMEGALDKKRLEEILRYLIRRHEALRTTFLFVDDKAVQKIHTAFDFNLDYMEIEEEEHINKIIKESIQPYDLTVLPLFRIKLVKLTKADRMPLFFLLLDMHHIITDGVSLGVLVHEINTLYAEKTLPKLRVRYVDYVEWYEKLLKGKIIDKQKKYWLKQYEGELPVLDLPTDYPRLSTFSFNGETVKHQIGRQLTDKLNRLARENRVTLYTVMFTAYNVLIARYTGQGDIVIGTPTAGRRHTDVQNLIGDFVNTLAIRNYPKLEKTFSEFLNEVGKNILKAFDNQDYPFDHLVDDLKINRDTSRNPLFDSMFILQNMNIGTIKAENIAIKDYNTEKSIAQFDITAIAVENETGIEIEFNFCTDLFKKETIERVLRHFIRILEGVTVNPQLKLSEIEMLSDVDKSQLMYVFNNTEVQYPKDKTVHELIEEQVKRTPESIALVFGNKQLTYSELNCMANSVAKIIREKGVKRDGVVGIIVNRSFEMLIGILGILKSGGAYLPIDPEYPEDRINYMLEDSGANILLTMSHLQNKTLFMGETILLDKADFSKSFQDDLKVISSPQDLAYLIYTSGSTGKPKGVMLEHRSVVNFIKGMTEKIDFSPKRTILALTTISFDIFVLETLLPLTQGSKIVIADEIQQRDPNILGKLIAESGIDMLQATPSRMQMLLSIERNHTCLRNLKYIMIGGEAFPPALLQVLKSVTNARILNMYGPTETTVWSTVQDLTDCEEINIGKPIANTSIYIVDKFNNLQPIGVAGELCIAGLGMARGYLGRPELTAEKFTKNPYSVDERMYRTGDAARWLQNGEIDFLSRMDSQVKIRGYRIELGEIESKLIKYAGTKEAVVTVREDEEKNKYLCAYLVLARELDISSLREHLKKELPDYMIPSYFMRLDKLPQTPNGKVDRKALPEQDIGLSTGVEYEAPRNETEEVLIRIWKEVLGAELIGIRDDFFAIGGDSLKAIKVVEKANRGNLNISLMDIMKYRTISEILGDSSQKHIAKETEIDGFNFDDMIRRRDEKIVLVSNAKECIHNINYRPIEYPFYYRCTTGILLEYLKYNNKYEIELDFLNAAIGETLMGIGYIEDEGRENRIKFIKPINGEKSGYPNVLEKLGISAEMKAFDDRDIAIEYILNRLEQNEIVPVMVTTYHLNYTPEYHMDNIIDNIKLNSDEISGFVKTMHTVIVVDVTRDSYVIHDTTFNYFGEISIEDFHKAFEGIRSIEVMKGHWTYDRTVPFQIFEVNTDNPIKYDMNTLGRESICRNLNDYFEAIKAVERLENEDRLNMSFGLEAMKKAIELFNYNVLLSPYNKEIIFNFGSVFDIWMGISVLFRNTILSYSRYYAIDKDFIDILDKQIENYRIIRRSLYNYDKENHKEDSVKILRQMEETYAFQKEIFARSAEAMGLNNLQ